MVCVSGVDEVDKIASSERSFMVQEQYKPPSIVVTQEAGDIPSASPRTTPNSVETESGSVHSSHSDAEHFSPSANSQTTEQMTHVTISSPARSSTSADSATSPCSKTSSIPQSS